MLPEKHYINRVLWIMHERNDYSIEYKELLAILENSEKCKYLDTVAWVYKDNGNTKKAIEIYKEKILPRVKKSGGSYQEYQKYFNRIKSNN